MAALAISSAAYAYQERNLLQHTIASPQALQQALVKDHAWIKYPPYNDRSAWQLLLGKHKDYCIEQGAKYLDYKWQVVQAMDYIEFARSGSRSVMEAPHNANIAAISSLFIAEMAEGAGRFIPQLVNGIFHVCEMTTWAASAHLSLQKARGSFPKKGDHAFDLVAGDIGATLAWILYLLKDEFNKITPLIAQRIYQEIDSRILTPYLDTARYWWMAENLMPNNMFVNNWNAWCNASALQCFLLVEPSPSRMAAGIYKSMVSVDKFLNYVNSDGACEEGSTYWDHAAGKMYDYLQILHDATAGRVSIFGNEMVKNMGEYIVRSYAGNGWVVNFADASARADFNPHLIYMYGMAVGSESMQHFASYLRNDGKDNNIPIARDAWRMLSALGCDDAIVKTAPEHTLAPFAWYEQTQVAYIARGRYFLAAKGGYNDESHNHNDIGTFILYADGQPLMVDAGVGTYTRKTFSGERYNIWTMQSAYHNLPLINGREQSHGRQYKAKDAKANAAKGTFSLDIAGAYPQDAGAAKWQRTYTLSAKGLLIEDDFSILNAKEANVINFLTWGKVNAAVAGVVSIEVAGRQYRLEYDKNAFAADIQTIELDDQRLSRVWGAALCRISLRSAKIGSKGMYKFTIN